MGKLQPEQNLFVNRDSGAIARVRNVDESFAYIEVLDMSGDGWGVTSKHSMPIAEYDTSFVEFWRPALADDLIGSVDDGFRPPANAPLDWD